MKSQNEQILKALKRGRKLTPLDMMIEFGCLRSSGRIYDLRQQGYNISTKMVKSSNGKHFAQYSMEK